MSLEYEHTIKMSFLEENYKKLRNELDLIKNLIGVDNDGQCDKCKCTWMRYKENPQAKSCNYCDINLCEDCCYKCSKCKNYTCINHDHSCEKCYKYFSPHNSNQSPRVPLRDETLSGCDEIIYHICKKCLINCDKCLETYCPFATECEYNDLCEFCPSCTKIREYTVKNLELGNDVKKKFCASHYRYYIMNSGF